MITGLMIPLRYTSERLPGKPLIEINGKCNLERIIKRALKSKIDKIVLAVSINDGEKIINWFNNIIPDSKYSKCKIYLGDHDNICERTLNAAKINDIDLIVDISCDCSLIDSTLINILIDRLHEYEADYSSNCVTRTFPNGFDVQVYTREIYQIIYDSGEYCPYYTGWNIFYAREMINPKPKIINLETTSEYYYPSWHLCLDNENDLKVIEIICNHFENNLGLINYDYKMIINYLKKNPEILKTNSDVIDTKLLKEKI